MNLMCLSIMILFSVIGFIIQCMFAHTECQKDYKSALAIKSMASFSFLAVGITAVCFAKDITISSLILVGLILGALGDVLLNIRFVVKNNSQKVFLLGTISFLLGHIFYIASLLVYAYNNDPESLYGAVINAVLITFIVGLLICTQLKVKKQLKIFGIIYVLIVSLFMCNAIYNLIVVKSLFSLLTSIGAVLFFASDVTLIFNSFGPKPKIRLRWTNLLLYFVGQILIGFAILF